MKYCNFSTDGDADSLQNNNCIVILKNCLTSSVISLLNTSTVILDDMLVIKYH